MKWITATLEWRRMIGTPTRSVMLNTFRAAACFLIPTSLVLVTLFIRHLSSNSAFIFISTTHLGSYLTVSCTRTRTNRHFNTRQSTFYSRLQNSCGPGPVHTRQVRLDLRPLGDLLLFARSRQAIARTHVIQE